ncbi:hypothetical protein BGX38DRAFT_212185 [Terfezia claveryi]|nr:hypothetical protein BGX38DRAFT_212185 [Terfezia claveryi]
MEPVNTPSRSIPTFNGNPTPPSSPTEDKTHSGIPIDEPSTYSDLPPVLSTSSRSTENGSPARSSAPNLQNGHRFYSERNPVPRVEHFPWESLYRGPVGIYRSPIQQRGSASSTTSHLGIGRGAVIVESTPVSPTTGHQCHGEGSGASQGEGLDQVSDKTSSRKSQSKREAVGEKHAKIVTDPITRKEVSVIDAKYLPPLSIPASPPSLSPPASWTLYSMELRTLTLKYIVGVLLSFLLLSGLFRFHMSIPLFTSFAAILVWYRQVDSLWLDVVHHNPVLYHRHRRDKSTRSGAVRSRDADSEPSGVCGPESVTWLNNTVSKLWSQINGDLFKPVTDMLEDVMQASIPSIIQQIRIRDIGQGTEPIKIISMRWLEHDDGEVEDDVVSSSASSEEKLARGTNNEDDQESIGEWACIEITFAFRGVGRGLAGGDSVSKASNPFLMVNMSLGLKGVLGAPEVPIWVELRGLQGTCRLKVQLIPDPPFIKLTTFSLMGMPKIEIAAVPLNQRFLNVMSLPVISDFVYSSIKTTAREFCAPKSFTMDVSKMLVGDDTKKELNAIGVFVVHIDRAVGVRAADKLTGKSDCYVTLSYAKFGKALWSSRIIFCELNPVWDETAILLVNAEELKAGERLVVEVWDSDRFTVDDLLGRVEVDIIDLVQRKGKMKTRTDSLMGFTKEQIMPGTLTWSAGFYGKLGLYGGLVKGVAAVANEVQSTAEIDRTAFTATTPALAPADTSTLVTKVPPSEAYPSGILSIQVHNIISLSVQSPSNTRALNQRIGIATNTEEEEESETLPSSYCSIILDHQKIYKTRIKPMTSKPFFNAGTERFVRDWRHSSVLVVVRDSRMRELDPILGVVELKLNKVFRNESVVSRYYPIQGGIGYGKVRISLLFRSIDTVLPRMLLGSDIGSVEVVSTWIDGSHITDDEVRKAGSITFETPLISKNAVRDISAGGVGWSPVHDTHGSTSFRLGVRHRHSAPCMLYFKRDPGSFKLRRDKVVAAAKFWLKDIPDDDVVTLRLDVFKPEDMDRFMQNAYTDDVKHVGFIEVQVRFHRGLGKSHKIAARQDRDFEDVIRAVRAVGVDLRREEQAENFNDADSEASISDGDIEEAPGGIKDAFSFSGSKTSRRVSTMSTRTAGALSASMPKPEEVKLDDASSSGDGVGSSAGGPVGSSASRRSRHIRAHSDPVGTTKTRAKLVSGKELRRDLNRHERGVMQWKGARTLAWVGKNVKNAGRGVKGKLTIGLGEGRGKRVGEHGRKVGWGTEV